MIGSLLQLPQLLQHSVSDIAISATPLRSISQPWIRRETTFTPECEVYFATIPDVQILLK
jgi:hypothetical protein